MASSVPEADMKRMFILESFGGDLFEVEEFVAIKFQIIKSLIEDDGAKLKSFSPISPTISFPKSWVLQEALLIYNERQ